MAPDGAGYDRIMSTISTSAAGDPSTLEPLGARAAAPPGGASPDLCVYTFGPEDTQGDGTMQALLGGKGANLAEMARIGLPVPPGFTITTEVCAHYHAHGRTFPRELAGQVNQGVAFIERHMGLHFSDAWNLPLLFSVRSGARASMPGLMDTILNLGLNDHTVLALARKTDNERFAWDCYRRFVQMYGEVVMGVRKRANEDREPFERAITALKRERYGRPELDDTKLGTADLQELVRRFQRLIRERAGDSFPQDPGQQLWAAIGAVFGSWMNDRAIVHRRRYNLPSEWGTAVNIQAMVYGNTGDHSGSGVAFTRDPATGAKSFYGEFLANAQGEDVVAGVRAPEPVAGLARRMPEAFGELEQIRLALERHFRDMQDFEFTIQDGKVFLLRTRSAQRTGLAAVRIAVEMENEGLIDWKTAVRRVPAEQLDQLLAPVFDQAAVKAARCVARGLPAGPGAAAGRLYLDAERAEAAAARGEPVILVRSETSPEDLRGMIAARGILTAKGGVSSHAALVARQMGKACVCGAAGLAIDHAARTATAAGTAYPEGAFISVDGATGEVYAGVLPTAASEVVRVLVDRTLAARESPACQNFQRLMDWCSSASELLVRANADTPAQAAQAIAFGATGIGLARTERMFFEGDRIDAMREMILADDPAARKAALAKLLPYQQADFAGIFRALQGRPATIRLLDPPLHEFLPRGADQQRALAAKLGVSPAKIARRVEELHEFNPMLGFRGCRLGIVYPEVSEMQVRAVFEAAADVIKHDRIRVAPEIMVPLVGFKQELDLQVRLVRRVAAEVTAARRVAIEFLVGTMIEIPRGALTADELARTAEFFSFGTNDLTQTCLGLSRDDSGQFLRPYLDAEILARDPFASIDQTGVGQLMEIAVAKGRKTRPDLKIGICGEQGGDPDSIRFCHRLGLTYVSCSPWRVPVARLAAAQAALEAEAEAAAG